MILVTIHGHHCSDHTHLNTITLTVLTYTICLYTKIYIVFQPANKFTLHSFMLFITVRIMNYILLRFLEFPGAVSRSRLTKLFFFSLSLFFTFFKLTLQSQRIVKILLSFVISSLSSSSDEPPTRYILAWKLPGIIIV